MRITFLLPGSAGEPVGGVKVVYEYANRLVGMGHEVAVMHSPVPRIDPPPVMKLKAVVRYPQRIIDKSYRPDRWMHVDSRVDVRWVPTCAERRIPRADVIVATAWKTAEWVARYGHDKGLKYYLIQHHEIWDASADRIDATWRLPLQKIVIAKWLRDIATGFGEATDYIPNGLDFSRFGVDVPIGRRPAASALMLYHTMEWKGSADGLAAAALVRTKLPDFRLTLFGVPSAPPGLPEWVTYYRNPPQTTLRRLYNEAAVFIAPSWAEGWPLPPAEAMMSGAALACTDIGGHREYAEHEVTALMSAARDPGALAQNIERLCTNGGERLRIANAGNGFIQQFTWERAVTALEAVLSGRDGQRREMAAGEGG